MLLPELVNRHKSGDGTIHVIADDDFAGFRGLTATRFRGPGEHPDLDGDPERDGDGDGDGDPDRDSDPDSLSLVRPGDVLLADAGMRSADPWVILDSAPAGVPVIVVFPNPAADAKVGSIVQSLTEHGLDLVEAQALESVYNRQIAVVGVREGPTIDPGKARRISWEWSVGDLVARAQAERRLVQEAEQAQAQQALQNRLDELTSAHAEVTAASRARIDELMATVADLKAAVAGSERTLRASRNAPSNRIGEAVLTLPRHPVTGLKGLSAELLASRRRHQNAATLNSKNKDTR